MKTSPETASAAEGLAGDDPPEGAPTPGSPGPVIREGPWEDRLSRRVRDQGQGQAQGRARGGELGPDLVPGHARGRTPGRAEGGAERRGEGGAAPRVAGVGGVGGLVEEVAVPAVPAHCCSPPLGRAWVLPEGPGCASYARGVLGEALASAGTPRAAVADARLMVSELATNAYQHAYDYGPHELWLYAACPAGEPGGASAHEAGGEAGDVPGGESGRDDFGELRCAVFDRHTGGGLSCYSWTSGDCGRGLSIVRELSDGRWGMLRTLSRCLPRVQGKAVWFTVPAAVPLPSDLLHRTAGAIVPVPVGCVPSVAAAPPLG